MADIFELASRAALTFESPKGELKVEDLWHLPLQSNKSNAANLDDIAKKLSAELKELEGSESFVTPTNNTKRAKTVRVKFDIVRHIISVLVRERDARATADKARETRARLLEVIEKKRNDELQNKSLDELQAQLRSEEERTTASEDYL